jgi:hypothetical protein
MDPSTSDLGTLLSLLCAARLYMTARMPRRCFIQVPLFGKLLASLQGSVPLRRALQI